MRNVTITAAKQQAVDSVTGVHHVQVVAPLSRQVTVDLGRDVALHRVLLHTPNAYRVVLHGSGGLVATGSGGLVATGSGVRGAEVVIRTGVTMPTTVRVNGKGPLRGTLDEGRDELLVSCLRHSISPGDAFSITFVIDTTQFGESTVDVTFGGAAARTGACTAAML